MIRRTLLTIITAASVGAGLWIGGARAQQSADTDAIKAAHTAFYTALSARDAKAMDNVWANKPYVINFGPSSKTAAVGHADAVAKYWPATFDNFVEMSAKPTSIILVQSDGKLATVVGTESALLKTKSGEQLKFDTFVTNIFEKDGNRWLMISHHAQRIPQ